METKRSEQIAQLAGALARAQGKIRTATKDRLARVKMRAGGEYTYRYATLDDIWDACRPALAENELSVVQVPLSDAAGLQLETLLAHSSGEWISGTMQLPVVADRMSGLQAMGSAITYARRYMLAAMVGVTTGDAADDDGEAAKAVERPPVDRPATNGTGPWQRLVARIKGELELGEAEARAILKELGFKAFSPAKAEEYLAALDDQMNNRATTPTALLVAVNRACGGYYKNVHHLKNAVATIEPGFPFPPAPADDTEWQTLSAMLLDHAEANQQLALTPETDAPEPWDATRDAMVNG